MASDDGLKRGRKPYPDNPEVPTYAELVPRAAGWNYSFDERMQMYRIERDLQAQEFIRAQALLPPEMRVRPPEAYNWKNPWDVISTTSYWTGARLKETEEFIKTGTYTPRSYAEKISPSETGFGELFGRYTGTGLTEEIASSLASAITGKERVAPEYRFTKKLTADVVLDPLTFVTSFTSGAKIVLSNGAKVSLTPAGTKLYGELLQKYKPIVTEGMVIINPEVRHIFSRMLRTNPKLYASAIEKQGLRIVGTNIQLLPKQFLPWTWISAGTSLGYKGITGGFNTIKSTLERRYSKLFPKQATTIPEKYMELKLAYDDTINAKMAQALKEVESIADDARNIIGSNAGSVLTEYIENPKFRVLHPELAGIYDRVETLHKQMAEIESAKGLLKNSRINYIRHTITQQAKIMKGFLGSKISRVIPDASYAISRRLDDTISAINAEHVKKTGVKLFESNAFNAIKQRYAEHIQSTQAVDFLKDVGARFGKTKSEAQKLQGFVKSTVVKGVYLPKDIERALKTDQDIKQLMTAMGKRSKMDVVYQVAKSPFVVAEKVNRFWARLVTVYFPGFHVTNYIGGKFNNYLAGNIDPTNDKHILDVVSGKKVSIVSKTGITYTSDDIKAIMERNGINMQPGVVGAPGARPDKVVEGLSAPMRKVGTAIETHLRGSLLIDRLKKGDTEAEAVAYINKFHFDYYQQLSKTEETLSKFLAFYMWNTRNTALQAEMLLKQTGKYAGLAKVMDISASGPEAQTTIPYKPPWMMGGTQFWAGGNRSNWVNVQLPAQSITQLPEKLESPLNMSTMLFPTWQIPIEEYRGIETFTGAPITNQGDYFTKKFFGRFITTLDKIRNPNIPMWEKFAEVGTGMGVYQATDWVAYSGVLDQSSERTINNALHRLNGRYHGCGF